jgi:hypothetical protein
VSEDSLTVAADGDLLNGTLIRTRGFQNAANNGVFALTGTSTGTAIKVASGTFVAETVSTTGSAQAQVCGFQFTASDLEIDSNGDLISTTQDLTALNLVDGHEIWIGGAAAGTRFATAAYNGKAHVSGTVTTNKIPLKWRSWTPAGADDGDTKTIRLFFGVCYRNVAQGHADYIDEPAWHMEKKDTGVGTGNADVFVYGERMAISRVDIQVAVEQKIEATINFVGARVTPPVLAASRKTGPSTATPPVAIELFDSTAVSKGGDTSIFKIVKGDDFSELVARVNSATLSIDHNAQIQKQIGQEDGPINFGKIRPSATMETFYEKYEVPNAIANNTSVRLEAAFVNDSGAVSIVFPGGVLSGGVPTYGEDAPVMMGVEFKAHRDPVSNQVAIINVLPYLPRKTVTAV